MTHAEQLKAIQGVLDAVCDTIRAAKTIPSGHLYAMLMGFMSLDQYNEIIQALTAVGKIRTENDLLIWQA
jgi:hypothetical protein